MQGGVIKSLQRTTLAELVAFAARQAATTHDDPPLETMADLEIKNLHVQAGDKQILKGVDLTSAPASSTR